MPAPIKISKQVYAPGTPIQLAASGTIDSNAIPVRGRVLSLKLVWTGTPTGTISLVCTFDGTTYDAIPGATIGTQPAGSASGVVVIFENVPGSAIKVRYTATSGTGTLTAFPIWV